MLSTNNSFDLLELQLFHLYGIDSPYVLARIVEAAAFPALDANALLLMGVSQGIYITGKAAGATSLARAVSAKAEITATQEQTANLEARKAVAQKELQTSVSPTKERELKGQVASLDRQIESAKAKAATLKNDLERLTKELGLS